MKNIKFMQKKFGLAVELKEWEIQMNNEFKL